MRIYCLLLFHFLLVTSSDFSRFFTLRNFVYSSYSFSIHFFVQNLQIWCGSTEHFSSLSNLLGTSPKRTSCWRLLKRHNSTSHFTTFPKKKSIPKLPFQLTHISNIFPSIVLNKIVSYIDTFLMQFFNTIKLTLISFKEEVYLCSPHVIYMTFQPVIISYS